MAPTSADCQDTVNEVYESTFNKLWRKGCGKYLNFGFFDDKCSTLIEANDNMVEWIVSELGVTESSKLLSIGCGRGKYSIEIAKKTGCTIVGLDIVQEFIDDAAEQAKEAGIEDKSLFVVGDMVNLPEIVKSQTFTHVIALGCLFYVHDRMPAVLAEINACIDDNSTLLIHDFARSDETALADVQDVIKHWRTTAQTQSDAEYRAAIELAGFEISLFRDDSSMSLKSCQWIVDTAAGMSDDTSTFTFWVLRDALRDGRIHHNTILAKRK